MLIYTKGESAAPLEFEKFLGPPHAHPGVTHISVVTRGEGLFYIQSGAKLLSFPVKRGSLVVIPADTIHTFYGGLGKRFDVASFTSELIATDSPRFQVLAAPATLQRLKVERL